MVTSSRLFNQSVFMASVSFVALSFSASVVTASDGKAAAHNHKPASLRMATFEGVPHPAADVSPEQIEPQPAPSAPEFVPYVSVFGSVSFGWDTMQVWNLNNNVWVQGHTKTVLLNTGWAGGAAIGTKWADLLRAEIEASHAQWTARNMRYDDMPNWSGAVSGTINANYLLGNIWAETEIGNSGLTPYLGGGIGIGMVTVKDMNFLTTTSFNFNNDSTQFGFAWQVGAGIKYDFTSHIALDLGYRLKSVEGMNWSNANGPLDRNGSVKSHNVQLGLTYQF